MHTYVFETPQFCAKKQNIKNLISIKNKNVKQFSIENENSVIAIQYQPRRLQKQ